MSSDNFVRSLFSVIDSANWERVQQFFHTDVVYRRPGYASIDGIARVMDFYRNERIISRGQHDVEGVVSHGEQIVCWGIFNGILKSGDEVSVRFADVYQTKNGSIIARETFFSQPAI
jgi:ketosteroid isomerase-like protein